MELGRGRGRGWLGTEDRALLTQSSTCSPGSRTATTAARGCCPTPSRGGTRARWATRARGRMPRARSSRSASASGPRCGGRASLVVGADGSETYANASRGGEVAHNVLSGAFSFGVAVGAVQDFAITNNTFVGNATFVSPPTPFSRARAHTDRGVRRKLHAVGQDAEPARPAATGAGDAHQRRDHQAQPVRVARRARAGPHLLCAAACRRVGVAVRWGWGQRRTNHHLGGAGALRRVWEAREPSAAPSPGSRTGGRRCCPRRSCVGLSAPLEC